MNPPENPVASSNVRNNGRRAFLRESDLDSFREVATLWGAGVGFFIGSSVVVYYVADRQQLIPRPEFAPLTCTIAGCCLGSMVFHGVLATHDGWQKVKVVSEKVSRYLAESVGLKPPCDQSAIVKACTSFGALWNIFANRELMYSLSDFENPLPDSTLCWFGMEGARELVITSVLTLTLVWGMWAARALKSLPKRFVAVLIWQPGESWPVSMQ